MQNSNLITKRVVGQDQSVLVPTDSDDGYFDSTYYGGSPENSERQQLYSVLAIFRKYIFLIIGIPLFVTAIVLVYEAQQPDYYTASVRIQVNNETNPAMGVGSAGSVVLNPGNDPAYFATQLQILEGPGLLRRVVTTLDLEHDPYFLRPREGNKTTVWQNVLRMFGLYRPPATEQNADGRTRNTLKVESAAVSDSDLDDHAAQLAPYVSAIKRNLDVDPVRDNRTATKDTRLIEVKYTHNDPAVVARVVNTLAETYVIQNLEQKVQSNSSVSDFLQKRVAELQSQIRIGEENLINYAKNNQILSLDSTQNTVVQRLSDLNGKLSQAENDRISAEAALRAAQQNTTGDLSPEGKDARTIALQAQLTTLRQQLEQLKVEYTDEWPAVKQVKNQIAAIEKELQTSKTRSTTTQLAGLQQKFRETATRESELRGVFEVQRKAVIDQNEAAVNYRIIQQEIDTNKSLLDNLLQRSRETGILLSGTPNNVNLVDRALQPGSPAGPGRSRGIITAFLASLFGSLLLAFALNWLDDTVRIHDNFELGMGLPVIGTIPGASKGFRSRLLGAGFNFKRNGHRRIGKFDYAPDRFDVPVIAEAYHQLRTSILLSTPGGAPKRLLVTSGQPFEGKTVTSLNLAKSLAELGGKVLLIDADMRSPKIHFINDLDNKTGLSTLLTASDLNSELIESTVRKDVEANLDILTSGPRVPNPVNLFASAEMQTLLVELDKVYSHIIIDSPPVLYFADSVILATSVEAVVLVARVNYSSRDVVLKAKKKIAEVHGNAVGFVLNDVPLGSDKYYSAAYYRQLEPVEEADGSILKLD